MVPLSTLYVRYHNIYLNYFLPLKDNKLHVDHTCTYMYIHQQCCCSYTCICMQINPYKPSVLFVGHRKTVQTQIRHRIMRCLIRIGTACLHNLQLKFGKKMKKYHLHCNIPKIGNELVQLIGVGNSIRLKWVYITVESR